MDNKRRKGVCQKVTVWFGSAQPHSSIWSFNNADGAWGDLSERDREEMKQCVGKEGLDRWTLSERVAFWMKTKEKKSAWEIENEWGKYWWTCVCFRYVTPWLRSNELHFLSPCKQSEEMRGKYWLWKRNCRLWRTGGYERGCVCVMEKEGMDKDKDRQITEIVTESGCSLQSVQAQVQYESFTQNK